LRTIQTSFKSDDFRRLLKRFDGDLCSLISLLILLSSDKEESSLATKNIFFPRLQFGDLQTTSTGVRARISRVVFRSFDKNVKKKILSRTLRKILNVRPAIVACELRNESQHPCTVNYVTVMGFKSRNVIDSMVNDGLVGFIRIDIFWVRNGRFSISSDFLILGFKFQSDFCRYSVEVTSWRFKRIKRLGHKLFVCSISKRSQNSELRHGDRVPIRLKPIRPRSFTIDQTWLLRIEIIFFSIFTKSSFRP